MKKIEKSCCCCLAGAFFVDSFLNLLDFRCGCGPNRGYTSQTGVEQGVHEKIEKIKIYYKKYKKKTCVLQKCLQTTTKLNSTT